MTASMLSAHFCKLALMTYGKRLSQALEHAKKPRAALARELEVSVQAVGQVLTGGRNGTQTFTAGNNVKAARFLRVDPHWLATGEGEMLSKTEWPGTQLTLEQIHTWTPELVKSVEDFALFQLSGAQAPRPETLPTSNNVFTADEHGNLSAQLPLETKKGRQGGKHSSVEAKRAQK